ncbi:MAG: M28 family peptidase [Candidatus Aminicenantes bacterium]|nr:M28 family peptidase [Candidatus Aminicenantes bacterium]
MKRLRWFLFPLFLSIVLSAPAEDTAGTAAFDKAIDKLFAEGYPQGLVTYFCSLGTNTDLGFRWAGTPAERAVGDRVAAEMRAMGLSNVRLEPVPVDVFEFEKASVTVGDRVMAASTIAGVPPTPEGGVIAPIVYVKGGTASDFDSAGDVTGKLVLMDAKMGSWWFTWPAFEAGHRKAAGVICTYTPEDSKYFSVDDSALGSFDGQYDLDALPWIYISRRDGDWLKSRIEAGPVMATMVLKEKVRLERDGGVAFNVIGELLGERRDGQMVLISAHQDAHFRAGVDDTAALANMLTVAKAMRASGHRPKTTVVFLATAGEEFGYTNAYYEWLTGAWWAATRAHKDWAGRVRAMLNLESMAVKEAPLTMRFNPELKPWLERLVSRCSALLPYGSEAVMPVNSWNDQWPFTAAGIPSVEFATYSADYDKLYHSNFETSALVDWAYLAKIAKFAFRAAQQLDDGLLPYSLGIRADDLAAAVNKEELLAAGANAAVVSRLAAGVSAFRTAAADFDARAGAIPAGRTDAVNDGLLEVEKVLNSGLTALSPADDDATVYPHQAVLRDAQGINAALATLKTDRPDPAAALKALAGTYMTRFGISFSYPVYLKQLTRLEPDFPRLTIGGQGQLPELLDVIPQYRKIESGDYAGAIAELEAMRLTQLGQLDDRLAGIAGVLEWAIPRIEALR